MEKLFYSSFNSSLGRICLASTTKGICWLTVDVRKKMNNLPEHLASRYRRIVVPAGDRHKDAKGQLEAYLRGRLARFNLPIDFIEGSDFQRLVWEETSKVPFGQVVAYKEIAIRISRPKAFRAVGQALGANPVAIIVPCHRVISSNGSLGGYGLGLEFKRNLLKLEGALNSA